MKNKQRIIRFIIRYIISIVSLLISSLLLLLLLYNFKFEYRYISNSLFIPSILVFYVSIGINVGALNIFNPMKYTLRKIINPKKTKEEFADYADYLEQKEVKKSNFWFLTIASITIIIIAIIFAII